MKNKIIIFSILIIIIIFFIINYANYKSPILYKLSDDELKLLFKNKKAKYLSKHDVNTHYIITYNDDKTFTTDVYINNIKSGRSYGTYSIESNGTCNIFYEYVVPSLHRKSVFNPMHPNHSTLTNYTLGPFYLIDKMNIDDDNETCINVYYKCKLCNNVLAFYPK